MPSETLLPGAGAAIDAVITWVDGADPAHRRKRERHMTPGRVPLHANGINPHRWACADELGYCLRSIANNAPWINRIWIVTDAQSPDLSGVQFQVPRLARIVRAHAETGDVQAVGEVSVLAEQRGAVFSVAAGETDVEGPGIFPPAGRGGGGPQGWRNLDGQPAGAVFADAPVIVERLREGRDGRRSRLRRRCWRQSSPI